MKNVYLFHFSVVRAKILKRKETGPSQSDDVVYTVKIIENYKVMYFYLIFTCTRSLLSTVKNSQ